MLGAFGRSLDSFSGRYEGELCSDVCRAARWIGASMMPDPEMVAGFYCGRWQAIMILVEND